MKRRLCNSVSLSPLPFKKGELFGCVWVRGFPSRSICLRQWNACPSPVCHAVATIRWPLQGLSVSIVCNDREGDIPTRLLMAYEYCSAASGSSGVRGS